MSIRKLKLGFIFILFFSFTLTSCMWPSLKITQSEILTVHFLNVGQGDCIFIQLPDGKTMLIDAGSQNRADDVISYITSTGAIKIDYVIGTHPHEDHIGSLAAVITNFEIGEIYMPKVITDTKTFEDTLAAIDENSLKINTASIGKSIFNSNSIKAVFLAPKEDYSELNNYSAVIKLTFNNISFLFTGDAMEISEKEMLENKNLNADVLKVAHHGSDFSTHDEFLKSVSPDYAVISCGKNNPYSHPGEKTLKKLKNIELYRTDLDGNIIFKTDGKNISVNTDNKGGENN